MYVRHIVPGPQPDHCQYPIIEIEQGKYDTVSCANRSGLNAFVPYAVYPLRGVRAVVGCDV
jgi:hypothetical protein